MAPVRLRHIHLPASAPDGLFPSYKLAAGVQELLRRRLLDFKDSEASSTSSSSSSSSSSLRAATLPHPTLISFTPKPTYTLGRRQAQTSSSPFSSSSSSSSSSLPPAEIARLKAPLRVPSTEPKFLRGLGVVPPPPPREAELDTTTTTTATTTNDHHVFYPAVLTSPRGGLTTYHGPGQVVLWPVMAINAPAVAGPLGYRRFSVRCYSRLLEDATAALLRRLFGLEGFTTGDPGVWVRTPPSPSSAPGGGGEGEVRKISALGIHLRRHVSSLGAAINLDMPTTTTTGESGVGEGGAGAVGGVADEETTNPWARFVACGLEGKGVTCVAEELRAAGGGGIPGLDAEVVARAWAEELARGIGLDTGAGGGVERVGRDEMEEIVAAAERGGFVEAAGRDEVCGAVLNRSRC